MELTILRVCYAQCPASLVLPLLPPLTSTPLFSFRIIVRESKSRQRMATPKNYVWHAGQWGVRSGLSCIGSFCACSLPLKQRKDKKSSVLGRCLVGQGTTARGCVWLLCVDVINTGGLGLLVGDWANFLCACSLGLSRHAHAPSHKHTHIQSHQ